MVTSVIPILPYKVNISVGDGAGLSVEKVNVVDEIV
jgi:hypothetical protein